MKQGAVRKRGFTIIEVVLVLGIAGLIFMMVFIALPTLQRNSRDAQRRDDMLAFVDALKKYQTNNRGALPTTDSPIEVNGNTAHGSTENATTWAGFYRDYLPNPFSDPSGSAYNLRAVQCGATTGECKSVAKTLIARVANSYYPNTLLVVVQASCNGENVVGAYNPRKVAILYKLEGGGVYCGEA